METLRPVFWGQGMFLQPQHFQQQDLYHDARLRQFIQLGLPHYWGVVSLSINTPALQNFIFEIGECELVTWEGAIVRLRAGSEPSNARIQPKSFEANLDKSGKPLSVYLGLRKVQPEESNLSTPEASKGAAAQNRRQRRYLLNESTTPDLFMDGGQRSNLQYLLYDLQILFDVPAARSQDYDLIKIAEVSRAGDGKGAALSARYIAPSLTISASPLLQSILKEIRDQLTAKAQELGEYRRRRGGQVVELGSRDIGYLFLTQTLNRYIPGLHHALELGLVHPHEAYAQLRQLIGELSTFSGAISVLGARGDDEPLPPYRHDQIWPCFQLALARVKELLSEITTGPLSDVQLQYDGECFSAALDPQLLAGDNRYYLAIKSNLSPAELFRLLQDTGKITSREDMPKLQKSFLFGLKIDVLESPPEELLMRAHYRYFAIDSRSEHWQKISEQKSIALFCSSLPPESEIRLVVVFSR